MNQPLTDQDIINCLKNNYAIDVTVLTILPIGADANARIYKAETHDKKSYFIKLKYSQHHIGATITTLLHDAGVREIIFPIKDHHGQLIKHINNFTLSVFPFVKGQDGFSRNLTDKKWVSFGKVMKKIHTIDVPPSIKPLIRREDYSSKDRAAVQSLYNYIESENPADEIAANFMRFMKQQAAVIHRFIARAEELAQKIQNQSPEFVLCHADIHGGNVLIDDHDNIYIVDWDDPIMAPKERDLMFIGGGVANVWNKAHEENLFYEGYGKTEINQTILAYYRYERIIEDIAEFGQQLLLATSHDHNRAESYQQFIAQFEPNGVVAIALKTDENIIN